MIIEFKTVGVTGLEASPVSEALAGLRANEARYFWNKFKIAFETFPATEQPELMADINSLLKMERDLEFSAQPLEIAQHYIEEEGILWTHVFYQDGLAINILYDFSNPKKQAVGLKLSDGMEIPTELVDRFKFARQKSKLAGTIRGSYFIIKGNHEEMIRQWVVRLSS